MRHGRTTVLVIDDEPAIHRFLAPALVAENYEVDRADTAAIGLARIGSGTVDIVVLDLGLPDLDGKEVIRRVRANSAVPIIVLSARDREAEKIEALDLGADDFVNKPFGVGELMARIRAALRHHASRPAPQGPIQVGDLTVDPARRLVRRGDDDIKLTRREFDLLAFLARHAGMVVTHRQILTALWGPAHAEDTQYLRVYVGQLRQKLERMDDRPLLITEPGVGYRLVDPLESQR